MTHRSDRWGNCRSAQPSRDAPHARRDGSVAGVECKNGFRQTWGWLGETQRVRLHRSSYMTSLSTWLLTLMALSVTSVVLNETQGEATTARLYGAERRLLGGRANS